MRKTNSLDMTKGSIAKSLLLFALPVLMSTLLQHFYSIVGSVVVGNFAANGTMAQAAIGATNQATKMLLNLFVGIALGANVVCSKLRECAFECGAGSRVPVGCYRRCHRNHRVPTSVDCGCSLDPVQSETGVRSAATGPGISVPVLPHLLGAGRHSPSSKLYDLQKKAQIK